MTNEELQQLIESNARAIQALTDRIAETDTISRRHSDEIQVLTEMIARFSLDAAADRREIRRSIEQIREIIERRFGTEPPQPPTPNP
jgi:predicted  nucleic acid-binding Zn-ribbon protein